uniref:Uncharacterized protein n=1 Tax=Aegilops tauschii subsp. strangulata TaxID=200361 RepID=A0A453GXU6_AEGTS
MERKPILLCLMVLLLLRNSTYAENCKTQIAYGATLCAFYTCLSTCISIYGKLVKQADCKPVRPYYTNCSCLLCV